MKLTLLAMGMGVLVVLAGCGEQKQPKTVEHYTANKAERDQVLAECKNNPGQLKDDPDCVNASAALMRGWGKAELPPLTWGSRPSGASAPK